MKIRFVKMSGAGNDMILIDHRTGFLAGKEAEFVRQACDRRRGIGADGVILLEDADGTDFAVRFFNPDGGEYELCGNGARCVPVFAGVLGFRGPRYRFRSAAGVHEAHLVSDGVARIQLAPVRDLRFDVEADLEGRPALLDWGDIGVPHAALWVEDVARVPVPEWGAHLRRHPAFGPRGTNVSFVEVSGADLLRIRTFERGVEGETLACGSGSAVVATLARAKGLAGNRVRLRVRSGEVLTVYLPETGEGAPELEGPVSWCFEGIVDPARLPPAPRER